MSKKQVFIIIPVLICILIGAIYFAWLESTKSSYLKEEINRLKIEVAELKTEKEVLLENIAELKKELEEIKANLPIIIPDLNIGFREPIRIITHSGYIDPVPHTIEAIKKAIDLGVYGIEIDIQFTKDYIPILLDVPDMSSPFNQITGGIDKNCTELTLKGIKQYKVKGLYEIPTLDEVLEVLKGKTNLLIIDTTWMPVLPENMDREKEVMVIQDTISRHNAEDFAIIQTADTSFTKYINFDKYKVAWNTSDIQHDYNISFYTLNPGWEITPEKVKEIHQAGAEVIPVNVAYSDAKAEEKFYLTTLLKGSKYIMVDYVENFKEFCKKYKIPIYEKK